MTGIFPLSLAGFGLAATASAPPPPPPTPVTLTTFFGSYDEAGPVVYSVPDGFSAADLGVMHVVAAAPAPAPPSTSYHTVLTEEGPVFTQVPTGGHYALPGLSFKP